MSDYKSFIASKHTAAQAVGFDVALSDINPKLFEWQKRIVQWACRQGRGALFEECGLGKTFQQIEWARLVADRTGQRVLILAPLAVAHQTIEEAHKLDVDARYCRSQDAVDDASERIIVANYDMLSAFDPQTLGGVVLDESSILKSFAGAMRNQIIDAFANTPYRLACTATPSPNDIMELGNHAEFLGVMKRNEMLSMYFKHDGGDTSVWRLKRHGEKDFWRWVTSWAICASKPSDLGYSDDGFDLPPLHLHEHVIKTDHTRAFAQGQLFVDGTVSATSMWQERRHSNDARCAKAIELVAEAGEEPFIVWCDTNTEADLLASNLPNAVDVRGADSVAKKERDLRAFSEGKVSQIVTKAEIAGYGLNWQHCSQMAFVGVTYSFEKTYQALRRAWRFGQTRPVHAHMIYAESEGGIRQSLAVKQAQHHEMQQHMNEAMREAGISKSPARIKTEYHAAHISAPAWL